MFSTEVCLLTLQKVAFLLVFILIGYLLYRKGVVERKAAGLLSLLTTTVFSPAFCLTTLPVTFTVANLKENLLVLALSLGLLGPAVGAAIFLAKKVSRGDFERRSLTYIFAFSNTGYFGYPVIEGVFGKEALGQFMIFCIPFNICIYSFGYSLFMNDGKKVPLKKILFSPVMISYYVGMAMGLTGIAFPSFLQDAVQGLGNCMSPASMLSAGIVLGSIPFLKLLSGVRSYLFSFIRLALIPAFFGVILYFLGVKGIYLTLAISALALPCGMNTVVFPESFGYDATDNAKLCFVSCLMAIITLPLVFGLIS